MLDPEMKQVLLVSQNQINNYLKLLENISIKSDDESEFNILSFKSTILTINVSSFIVLEPTFIVLEPPFIVLEPPFIVSKPTFILSEPFIFFLPILVCGVKLNEAKFFNLLYISFDHSGNRASAKTKMDSGVLYIFHKNYIFIKYYNYFINITTIL